MINKPARTRPAHERQSKRTRKNLIDQYRSKCIRRNTIQHSSFPTVFAYLKTLVMKIIVKIVQCYALTKVTHVRKTTFSQVVKLLIIRRQSPSNSGRKGCRRLHSSSFQEKTDFSSCIPTTVTSVAAFPHLHLSQFYSCLAFIPYAFLYLYLYSFPSLGSDSV